MYASWFGAGSIWAISTPISVLAGLPLPAPGSERQPQETLRTEILKEWSKCFLALIIFYLLSKEKKIKKRFSFSWFNTSLVSLQALACGPCSVFEATLALDISIVAGWYLPMQGFLDSGKGLKFNQTLWSCLSSQPFWLKTASPVFHNSS